MTIEEIRLAKGKAEAEIKSILERLDKEVGLPFSVTMETVGLEYVGRGTYHAPAQYKVEIIFQL